MVLHSVNGWTIQKIGLGQDQSRPGYCVYRMCVQPSGVQALFIVLGDNHVCLSVEDYFLQSSRLESPKSSKTSVRSTYGSLKN